MSRSIRRLLPTRRSVLGALLLPVLATAALAPDSGAQTPCARSQRDVLVFIADLDSPNHTWIQRRIYNAIEYGAEALARTALTPVYRRVHVVRRASATQANLPRTLRNIAEDRAIRAVDPVFVTHGLDGHVAFSERTVSMATVRNDIIRTVPRVLRGKFRMVFSTACYGASHRSGWPDAGFATASGSRRIYVDSFRETAGRTALTIHVAPR